MAHALSTSEFEVDGSQGRGYRWSAKELQGVNSLWHMKRYFQGDEIGRRLLADREMMKGWARSAIEGCEGCLDELWRDYGEVRPFQVM